MRVAQRPSLAQAQRLTPTLTAGPSVYLDAQVLQSDDIVQPLLRVVRENWQQTRQLATRFRSESREQTLQLLFDFLRSQIKYVEDGYDASIKDELQKIRQPARILADGYGDCKSYTILASSILRVLGIDHLIRFVSFDGTYLNHVYVVVGSTAVDACTKRLGQEQPYRFKQDYPMRVQMISGLKVGCPPSPVARVALHPNQRLSPSQLAWERERQAWFNAAAISGRMRRIGIPAAVISEVVQNNLEQPVDTQVKRSLSASITKNPYLMEILTGELKGIPVIGPLLDKLFGKCGVFAGWDKISQAQLARVNDYYQYTGREIIPPKSDAECNWRTTVHPSRVAIELNAEREAIMVQFQVKYGTNELAKLMLVSAEAFTAAMEQKNYWPGWGDMLRYRNSIIADWKKQSNGDGGILTVELMLAVDSLRIAAKQVYGFTYVPGQIPPRPNAFEQTNNQLLDAAGIPKSADQNPGNSNTSGGGGVLAALAALGFLLR